MFEEGYYPDALDTGSPVNCGAGICTIEGLIAKKTIRRCIQIIVILKEEIK